MQPVQGSLSIPPFPIPESQWKTVQGIVDAGLKLDCIYGCLYEKGNGNLGILNEQLVNVHDRGFSLTLDISQALPGNGFMIFGYQIQNGIKIQRAFLEGDADRLLEVDEIRLTKECFTNRPGG